MTGEKLTPLKPLFFVVWFVVFEFMLLDSQPNFFV